jgi:RNA polymerase sigma factor (sigma-70 family)
VPATSSSSGQRITLEEHTAVVSDDERRQFEDLFRDHVQAVFRYALARSGDHDTARDVIAETFLVAWRSLPEVPGDPRAWLLGVARRVLQTQFRASYRRRALYEKAASQPLYGDGSDLDPSKLTAEKFAVRAAFVRLSARDQEVLSLVAWEGLSNVEAAKVLQLSHQGFRVRLHRARKRFAVALQAEGYASPSAPDSHRVAQIISPIEET